MTPRYTMVIKKLTYMPPMRQHYMYLPYHPQGGKSYYKIYVLDHDLDPLPLHYKGFLIWVLVTHYPRQ